QDRQQQMFGADVLVAKLGQLVMGAREHGAQARRDRELHPAAADTRQAIELAARLLGERADSQIELTQDLRHDAVALLQQRQQQVLGLDLAVAVALGDILGRNNGLFGLLRQRLVLNDIWQSPPLIC